MADIVLNLSVTEANVALAALEDYRCTLRQISNLQTQHDQISDSQADACADAGQKLMLNIDTLQRKIREALSWPAAPTRNRKEF